MQESFYLVLCTRTSLTDTTWRNGVRDLFGLPMSVYVSWSPFVSLRELNVSRIFFPVVCCYSRPLQGYITVLAGSSTFTMVKLWGFPDRQPELEHKACSGICQRQLKLWSERRAALVWTPGPCHCGNVSGDSV